tara:strand:- start:704 stop:1789 length:1086 start_codon:yes stop_codon:yes gene_type:complete
MQNFMGKDGFQWFVGVVEDRQDPKKVGRVRVRCLGYHSENISDLPTDRLPWAHPMNPVTSATVSGVGQTPLGAVEGTWVVGFFQDGADAQQPIIIGTLPGVPSSLPTKGAGKGFQDRLNANYPKYTETDMNRLAVNDSDNPHPSLSIRQADRTTNIGRADFNPVDVSRANAPAARSLPGDDGTNFNEPETTYKTQYPHNHVYESEAGHIVEFDDTPNSERIHERHSTGTGYEINEFGDKVQRVKRDNYEIISNDHFAHIKGTHNTTVDGGVRVFVNANGTADSNYTIQVGNNANVNVQVDKGNINLVATQGEINMKAEDMNIDITKDFRVKAQSVNFEVNGSYKEIVTGSNTKTGDPINLN